MNNPHVRPCIAVLQPTQSNGPPQFVVEPKLFGTLRFDRSDSLRNRMDSQDIRWEFEVGMVPAQDLSYDNHQSTDHNNELTCAATYFIDDHPESIAIRLPGRPIAF